MKLIVVRLTFQVGDYVLPVSREDVLVVAVKTLVDLYPSSVRALQNATKDAYIGPGTCIKLGDGRITLRGELDNQVSRSVHDASVCHARCAKPFG